MQYVHIPASSSITAASSLIRDPDRENEDSWVINVQFSFVHSSWHYVKCCLALNKCNFKVKLIVHPFMCVYL